MRTLISKLLFALCLFLLASGCGFHLRGLMDIPRWLDQVAIINQGTHHDLDTLIKEQLQANHVKVCADPALAKYWLILESDSYKQQITSISSSTTPRQYQLLYSVLFKLKEVRGKDIIPSGKVVVNRQITLNSNRILGSDSEEALIQKEMRQSAATKILTQLSR